MAKLEQTIEELFHAQRRKAVNPIVRALIVVVCIFYAPIFALIEAAEKRRRVP